MSTLHDRLADLAEHAPTGYPDPGLWERGRRYGRRRRAGTAVIVVVTVVLLGLVIGASELRSRSGIEPAGPTTAPALPSRIVRPSPWLDGTDDAGPLGQLAALVPAERRSWTGTWPDVAGVSAATGEYRFLDLPDASPDRAVLAPDGRHVAYWYTGDTRLSPNSESGPVVGVAVYDTTTEEVVRHPIATDHGLMVDDRIIWVDADRLVFSYHQYRGGDGDDPMDQSSASDGPGLLLWAPGSGEDPTLLPSDWSTWVRATDRAGHLLVTTPRGDRLVSVDEPHGGVAISAKGGSMVGDLAVDSRGNVAWPRGSRHPNRVTVVPVGGERYVVPNSGQTFAGVAWIDDAHLAVSRRVGRGYERVGLFEVDVRTGASALLVEFPRQSWDTELATELIGTPPVDRALPPEPLDPRLTAGLGLLVLVAGGASYLMWRRRVRA